MKKKLLRNIATLGFVGYLPAPGTCATLCTLPLVVALSFVPHWYPAVLLCTVVASFYIIGRVLHYYFPRNADPQEIVLDEVIGTLITFGTLPITWHSLIIGFALFRFFDISKPLFIKKLQEIPKATGIIIDDVAAGVIAHAILFFLYRYI